jgi:hypothetical protein
MHFPARTPPRANTTVSSVWAVIKKPSIHSDAPRSPMVRAGIAASITCKLTERQRNGHVITREFSLEAKGN